MPRPIVFGPSVCRDFARASKLEWLETNGAGGFAMGTIAGLNTRRYHALLVASLRPPVERYALLSRVDEEISLEQRTFQLGACQYPGVLSNQGVEFLDEFRVDPCATWRWGLGGGFLEKQVYLEDRRQSVILRYRSDRVLSLRVRPFLAYRDYHSLGRAREDLYGGLPPLVFQHDGRFEENGQWYYNLEYLAELDRGLDFREDLFTPGVIVLTVQPGQWTTLRASVNLSERAADSATVSRVAEPSHPC